MKNTTMVNKRSSKKMIMVNEEKKRVESSRKMTMENEKKTKIPKIDLRNPKKIRST